MVSELLDEHEQSERVRAWLRDNGGAIIGGIVLGLVLLFGYQWWRNARMHARVDAAGQFQALEDAAGRGDRDGVDALAASLTGEFGSTVYATWARFEQADQQLSAGEFATARETLAAAIEHAGSPLLADLGRVRLARVELAAGEPEAALKQLDAVAPARYDAIAAEVRGDALQKLGRADEAREAYRQALAELAPASPGRRLVEMKLIDAGGAPAQES